MNRLISLVGRSGARWMSRAGLIGLCLIAASTGVFGQSLKTLPTAPKEFEEAFAKTFASLYGNKKSADAELVPFWAVWSQLPEESQAVWIRSRFSV